MGDIYFNAHNVLIWLGPDDGTTAEAVRSFRLIMAQCRAETDGLTKLNEVLWIRTSSRAILARYDYSHDSDLPQDLNWTALRSFFSCKWFNRVWTVQEAALGLQSMCSRGGYIIDWMDILVSAQWLFYKRYWIVPQSLELEMNNTRLMFTLRSPPLGCNRPGHAGWCRVGQCHEGKSIDHLLENVRFFGSSEPRDKLYGIRSLMSKEDASRLRPDYDMEVAKIFADVAKFSIRSEKDICALRLSGIQGGVDLKWYEKEKWPSWVPCWHLSPVRQLDPKSTLGHRFHAVDGIGVDSSQEEIPWWLLRLRGVEVGEVHYVSAIIPRRQEPWSGKKFQQLLQGIWDHALGSVAGLPMPVARSAVAFLMSGCAGSDNSRLAPSSDFEILRFEEPQKPSDGFLKFDDTTYVKLSSKIMTEFLSYAPNRRLLVTSNGYIGLCTRYTQPGDIACILEGGNVPYVLRSDSDHWLMLGECYVYGVMQGELIQTLRRSQRLEQCWRTFDIR